MFINYLLWPALLAGNLGVALHAVRESWDYSAVLGALIVTDAIVLMLLEWRFPLRREWRMTWPSFLRDLKYLAAGNATFVAVNVFFGMLSVRLNAGHAGPLTGWPLWVAVPATIFAVDFLNYWQHRWSHQLPGALGRFLWRTHVAHHLPDRVYVLMHVAAHPLNAFVVRGFVILLPMYLLGATPEAALLANTIIALQGLVSHCNLDIRAGWFNYLLVGTELHRDHHSANIAESKNYAATFSFIDIAFGTFHYRAGMAPERLGVDDPRAYPDSNEFWKVMRLPFVSVPGKETVRGGIES